MLVERSMHPEWLSNAYLIADDAGGNGLFVDSGAPLAPLLAAVVEWGIRPVGILRTHAHHDHVAHEEELREKFGIEVERGNVTAGRLSVRALPTPGHSDDMVAFVVNDEIVFTGDTLFKDAVGGGDAEQVRRSVMEVLMELPHTTRVLPGHTEETTIGREWEQNPFVRYWRGEAADAGDPVRVGGRDASLVVWSPDYDGNGKALVRFADGGDAIVGGSRVERL